MARVHEDVEDDLDEAADEASENDEDEDEDEELDDEEGADAYEKLSTRLTTRVDKQISKYVENQRVRLDKYRRARAAWRQRRLDEFALAHIGSAAIHNPAAVEESIERQVKAAEEKLSQLQAQRTKLREIVAQGGAGEEEVAS